MSDREYEYFKRYMDEKGIEDLIEVTVMLAVKQSLEAFVKETHQVIDVEDVIEMADKIFDSLREEIDNIIYV